MNKVKSYTDLEQSKKLAEILKVETADMFYAYLTVDHNHKYIAHYLKTYSFKIFKDTKARESVNLKYIPCWSLAALLNVLPSYELNNFGNAIQLDVKKEALETEGDETLLDLVVNMIIHLYECKKL